MPAHLLVRSVVPDVQDRTAFDRWYGEDHMAEAIRVFAPARCWRSWSEIDPAVHYAFYEFEAVEDVQAMMATAAFAAMVDDFTRTWDGKVTRARDVIHSVQLVEKQTAPRG